MPTLKTPKTLKGRLRLLNKISLNGGGHSSFDNGHCAMEVASWLAGEPHSAETSCVCPNIRGFVINWNDNLPDDEARNRLIRPLIPLMLNTRGGYALELRRSKRCLDYLVREITPDWLEIAGLTTEAAALRAAPSLQTAQAAALAAAESRKKAWGRWDAALAAALAAVKNKFEKIVAKHQAGAVELLKELCAMHD